MKKKKLGILVALLLIASAGAYTYARYTDTFTGTGTADVAKWAVKVTGEDTKEFDLTLVPTEDVNVAAGKLAPGGTAAGTIELDLSGTEVSTEYTLTIGDVSKLPAGVTISKIEAKNGGSTIELNAGNNFTDTITHEEIVTNGKVELTVTVEWANDEDNNATDTAAGVADTDLTIPVSVFVNQYLG